MLAWNIRVDIFKVINEIIDKQIWYDLMLTELPEIK